MSSGSSDEGAQSEDNSDGEAFDSVTVDFDFAEPQESDFLGLKTLLTNYLDGQQYDASGLVDLVLKHVRGATIFFRAVAVVGRRGEVRVPGSSHAPAPRRACQLGRPRPGRFGRARPPDACFDPDAVACGESGDWEVGASNHGLRDPPSPRVRPAEHAGHLDSVRG